MFTREELLKSPEYWFEGEQNELFRQLSSYMKKENINQSELAQKLNVSKGYISQILNGNSNFSMKKLIEFALAINLVPQINYESLEVVIENDNIKNGVLNPIKEEVKVIPINKPLSSDASRTYFTQRYSNTMVADISEEILKIA